MPEPGSNRGYIAWQYIEPIVLMFIEGGRNLEDLREVIMDEGLGRLTGMKQIPSTQQWEIFKRDRAMDQDF